VNDASIDSSLEILRDLEKKYKNLKVISRGKNGGHGAALKTGFSNVKTEFLAFLDADMTYHPKYISQLYQVVKEENLDCAWCNRFAGKFNEMPFVRRVGNQVVNLLLFLITGRYVGDATSGQRLFRTASLRKLDPKTLPDKLDMVSALSKRTLSRKLKFKLIPCDYAEREGRSKLNLITDFLKMLKDVVFEK
jgi:glycosyltransferase involved in cell wall biosynthesis